MKKLGSKIRDAQIQKIPYMIVIGEKEQTNKILAVRKRRSKETITFTIDELTDKLSLEVSEKMLGESIQPI